MQLELNFDELHSLLKLSLSLLLEWQWLVYDENGELDSMLYFILPEELKLKLLLLLKQHGFFSDVYVDEGDDGEKGDDGEDWDDLSYEDDCDNGEEGEDGDVGDDESYCDVGDDGKDRYDEQDWEDSDDLSYADDADDGEGGDDDNFDCVVVVGAIVTWYEGDWEFDSFRYEVDEHGSMVILLSSELLEENELGIE